MTYAPQPQGGPYSAAPQQPYGSNVYDAQTAYVYERTRRVSVTKAYGAMTVGLLITAATAFLTQATNAYVTFIAATGLFGMIALIVAQVGLAIYLGARLLTMSPATARVLFYGYAALMGFTLSTIFMVYDLGSIALTFVFCSVFYFALTMLGVTTKANLLKAGPILFVGLIVLIVSQMVLMFIAPTNTTLMVVSAIGVVLFAGMTVYDAQRTRAIMDHYQQSDPDMLSKVSILCALNLYLDFINLFLYMLRFVGSRD